MRRLCILTAALALTLSASAKAVYYDGGVDRFFGGNANGMTNNEAIMFATAALKRHHYWVDGGSVRIVGHVGFNRVVYVRAYLPLPDCLVLRREPWSWATNNSTSTFVGIWGYTGKPCGNGP